MDPNATLTELRTLVPLTLARPDAPHRIAELVQALDEWIVRGGFMPDAWNRDEHNGWCNRETWAAALHLGNDEGIYNAARDAIRAHVRQSRENWSGDAGEFTQTAARSYAADGCREYVDTLLDGLAEDNHHDAVVAMLSDVGSLFRVDWRAVSESLVDDDELGALLAEQGRETCAKCGQPLAAWNEDETLCESCKADRCYYCNGTHRDPSKSSLVACGHRRDSDG